MFGKMSQFNKSAVRMTKKFRQKEVLLPGGRCLYAIPVVHVRFVFAYKDDVSERKESLLSIFRAQLIFYKDDKKIR